MSTYKSDACVYPSELEYGSYEFVPDQQPCKGDSSRLDSAHTSRWWLNHHALEQSNVLDVEAKLSEAGDANGNGKLIEHHLIQEYCTECSKNDAAYIAGMSLKRCCSPCKNDGDSWSKEFEATVNSSLLSNVDFMDYVSCNSLLLEQSKKFSSDIDSHWVGLKKNEPWWQAADKDEPSSLVSQSRYLPGFQALHSDKISDNHEDNLGQLEEKIVNKATSNVKFAQGSVTSVRLGKSLGKQGIVECLVQESDGIFSSKDGSSDEEPSSSDLTRAQLLEALCHSQTRAREAEKLAQEACDEKDHVINLFFQQASWLFAYRQWLRLLQLESLCLHVRSKTHLPPFTPPSFLPWVRPKGVTVQKKRDKPARRKPGKQNCHLNKYAIAFAVGLTLAGAGVLFGWTIGWLFPAL